MAGTFNNSDASVSSRNDASCPTDGDGGRRLGNFIVSSLSFSFLFSLFLFYCSNLVFRYFFPLFLLIVLLLLMWYRGLSNSSVYRMPFRCGDYFRSSLALAGFYFRKDFFSWAWLCIISSQGGFSGIPVASGRVPYALRKRDRCSWERERREGWSSPTVFGHRRTGRSCSIQVLFGWTNRSYFGSRAIPLHTVRSGLVDLSVTSRILQGWFSINKLMTTSCRTVLIFTRGYNYWHIFANCPCQHFSSFWSCLTAMHGTGATGTSHVT